jgi:ATP-dependent Clp protease ATP-binding subunit ClpC
MSLGIAASVFATNRAHEARPKRGAEMASDEPTPNEEIPNETTPAEPTPGEQLQFPPAWLSHRTSAKRAAGPPEPSQPNLPVLLKPGPTLLDYDIPELPGNLGLVNMNQQSLLGNYPPIIGRDEEIRRLIEVLLRDTKNNPVVIGEAGVGKTAAVKGLVQLIVRGQVPNFLKNKVVISVSVGSLIAGARYRGDAEERMMKLLDVAKKNSRILYFFDELHMVVGAGAAEGSVSLDQIIKPPLADGSLTIIGATTVNEYRKIEKDSALERRMQPVLLSEPSLEDTFRILVGLRSGKEGHYDVRFESAALHAAVKLANGKLRGAKGRNLPDSAIDLVDLAGAHVALEAVWQSPETRAAVTELRNLALDLLDARHEGDLARLAELEKRQESFRKVIEDSATQPKHMARPTVTADDIARAASDWTGVPLHDLTQDDRQRLLALPEFLAARVIGQPGAVLAVAEKVQELRVLETEQPIVLLFAGPTGVGKTELARALAEFFFGSRDAVIKIAMEEYADKFSLSKFFGAPPGYVGYEEAGQLTEAVRKKPFSIVLLDELEKAHREIQNGLLGIFEDGYARDGQGRKVDFSNCVFIATSNAGAEQIAEVSLNLWMTNSSVQNGRDQVEGRALEQIRKQFSPEFLNRIDEIRVFNQLTREDIAAICALQLATINKKKLAKTGVTLSLSPEVFELVVKEGYNPVNGARAMNRTLQKRVVSRLTLSLLEGKWSKGAEVEAYIKPDGSIDFRRPEEGVS